MIPDRDINDLSNSQSETLFRGSILREQARNANKTYQQAAPLYTRAIITLARSSHSSTRCTDMIVFCRGYLRALLILLRH